MRIVAKYYIFCKTDSWSRNNNLNEKFVQLVNEFNRK